VTGIERRTGIGIGIEVRGRAEMMIEAGDAIDCPFGVHLSLKCIVPTRAGMMRFK
jgi:hypothetical protein